MNAQHAFETPTTFEALDAMLQRLSAQKGPWAAMSIPERITLLEGLVARTDTHAQAWVDAAVKGKQLEPGSSLVGEEWTSGPWAFIVACQGLIRTLSDIQRKGTPTLPGVRALADGRAVVKVFPADIWDTLLLNGFSAEVWMQDGVTPANLPEHIGAFYRNGGDGAVALVLGAGNITSIPPLDTIHRLFSMGHVVALKMNPVNAWLGPVFTDIFKPLIDAGFFAIAYGGAAEGSYLTQHALVDELHLTGSEHTHDAIVFGTGKDGAARKAKDEPQIDKPFTSELGGVGGTFVIPGDWTPADLRFQAENIVSQKLHNSGHNCVASQVLVLPAEWPLADQLEQEIRNVLSELPTRVSWYPGAADRRDAVANKHDAVETFGGPVPRTLLTGIDATTDHFAFDEEFFGVIHAITRLPGATAEAFLNNAVAFANDRLKGTLGVNLIVHPRTREALGARFEQALTDLRFGSIGVNAWVGAAFLLPFCTWGAYPGHPRNDIQSGSGVVHNAFLFDKPEKTVVTAPFAPMPRAWASGELHISPKPLWFVTNKTAHLTGERVTHFAANPSAFGLPAIFAAALRG